MLPVSYTHLDVYKRQAWMLNSWQIVVERYPKYGEQITVGTWPYDFKGPLGLRNFIIDDASGERMARANSVWAMIDVTTGRPVRVDKKMCIRDRHLQWRMSYRR